MKVLFIGGNGNISWWCVQKAIEKGYDVYELNRAMTRKSRRKVQNGVHQLIADIRDESLIKKLLSEYTFDVVCDFICFNSTQAEEDIRLFKKKIKQFIVISSEAVYKRETRFLPFVENTPQYDDSVGDGYISGKVSAEKVFKREYNESGFPVTIVRPGYTYDTIIQMPLGLNCFTIPKMLLEGYPFIMYGDGENLVAPLHSSDFATAFAELLGNKVAIGQTYQITADKLITWNEMASDILYAFDLDVNNILHIPYNEAINITEFCSPLMNYEHMWHYLFDNSKIKSLIPDWKQKVEFDIGIKYTVNWLFEDTRRQRVYPEKEKKIRKIYYRYGYEAIK